MKKALGHQRLEWMSRRQRLNIDQQTQLEAYKKGDIGEDSVRLLLQSKNLSHKNWLILENVNLKSRFG